MTSRGNFLPLKQVMKKTFLTLSFEKTEVLASKHWQKTPPPLKLNKYSLSLEQITFGYANICMLPLPLGFGFIQPLMNE